MPPRMYRAILSEGQIVCKEYDRNDEGVDLYDEDEQFIAFVPYTSLNALIDEDVYNEDERSIM